MAQAFLGILLVLILFQLGAFAKKKGDMKDTHKFSLQWPLYLYILTVLLSAMIIFAVIYYISSIYTPILKVGHTGNRSLTIHSCRCSTTVGLHFCP